MAVHHHISRMHEHGHTVRKHQPAPAAAPEGASESKGSGSAPALGMGGDGGAATWAASHDTRDYSTQAGSQPGPSPAEAPGSSPTNVRILFPAGAPASPPLITSPSLRTVTGGMVSASSNWSGARASDRRAPVQGASSMLERKTPS